MTELSFRRRSSISISAIGAIRQQWNAEVRSRIVERCPERNLKSLSRIFGGDDRINEAARGGKLCVKLTLVLCSNALHLFAHRFVGLAALGFELIEFAAEQRHHSRIAFHNTHSARRPCEDEIRIKTLS